MGDKAVEKPKKKGLGFNIVKAGDMNIVRYKFLIYGQSGAGKSHLAALSPGVLHVTLEEQAKPTVKRANPDALIADISDMAGFRALMTAARSGALPDGVETLVVDSFIELQRMLMDDIKNGKTKNKGVFSKQDWGTLANRSGTILRWFRDMPYNVVLLTLAASDTSGDVRRVVPSIKGSTKVEAPGYFNAVGYAYKVVTDPDSESPTVQHHVMFEAGEEYMVKPFGDLTGVVVPDPSAWIAFLNGEEGAEVLATGADRPSKTKGKRRLPRGKKTEKGASSSDDSDDSDDDKNTEPATGF